ncbi:MAG: hypothetical protein NTX86_04680 [Candidatus Dependentiae bacterium]|nr:hypothetical protein [Candidatus Dependentiae bacterium]
MKSQKTNIHLSILATLSILSGSLFAAQDPNWTPRTPKLEIAINSYLKAAREYEATGQTFTALTQAVDPVILELPKIKQAIETIAKKDAELLTNVLKEQKTFLNMDDSLTTTDEERALLTHTTQSTLSFKNLQNHLKKIMAMIEEERKKQTALHNVKKAIDPIYHLAQQLQAIRLKTKNSYERLQHHKPTEQTQQLQQKINTMHEGISKKAEEISPEFDEVVANYHDFTILNDNPHSNTSVQEVEQSADVITKHAQSVMQEFNLLHNKSTKLEKLITELLQRSEKAFRAETNEALTTMERSVATTINNANKQYKQLQRDAKATKVTIATQNKHYASITRAIQEFDRVIQATRKEDKPTLENVSQQAQSINALCEQLQKSIEEQQTHIQEVRQKKTEERHTQEQRKITHSMQQPQRLDFQESEIKKAAEVTLPIIVQRPYQDTNDLYIGASLERMTEARDRVENALVNTRQDYDAIQKLLAETVNSSSIERAHQEAFAAYRNVDNEQCIFELVYNGNLKKLQALEERNSLELDDQRVRQALNNIVEQESKIKGAHAYYYERLRNLTSTVQQEKLAINARLMNAISDNNPMQVQALLNFKAEPSATAITLVKNTQTVRQQNSTKIMELLEKKQKADAEQQ